MNFLQVKRIFPYNQSETIEKATFTYSSFGKAFDKQTKTTEEQGRKKIDAITNSKRKTSHFNQ